VVKAETIIHFLYRCLQKNLVFDNAVTHTSSALNVFNLYITVGISQNLSTKFGGMTF